MKNPKISVCMATYNGEKYIKEQIESILKNLNAEDEVIIVDDKSKDKTVSIIESYNDRRIVLIKNEKNLGVNKSFEIGINSCKNEYIFLADQDDIWIDGRVNKMIESLMKNQKSIVAGNQEFIDSFGKKINYSILDLDMNDSEKKMKNIYRIFIGNAYYTGCAMAFKKDIKSKILPFPNYIESHDLWIAKIGILENTIFHLQDKVLKRRIHSSNVSIGNRSLTKKIKSRIIFLISAIEILLKRIK